MKIIPNFKPTYLLRGQVVIPAIATHAPNILIYPTHLLLFISTPLPDAATVTNKTT